MPAVQQRNAVGHGLGKHGKRGVYRAGKLSKIRLVPAILIVVTGIVQLKGFGRVHQVAFGQVGAIPFGQHKPIARCQ